MGTAVSKRKAESKAEQNVLQHPTNVPIKWVPFLPGSGGERGS